MTHLAPTAANSLQFAVFTKWPVYGGERYVACVGYVLCERLQAIELRVGVEFVVKVARRVRVQICVAESEARQASVDVESACLNSFAAEVVQQASRAVERDAPFFRRPSTYDRDACHRRFCDIFRVVVVNTRPRVRAACVCSLRCFACGRPNPRALPARMSSRTSGTEKECARRGRARRADRPSDLRHEK